MVYSVQYLRGIAALLVVIYHSTIKYQQYYDESFTLFYEGQLGVDLFFIISGFIMCQISAGRPFVFKTFVFGRIKRIIPIYWLLTIFALLVYIAVPQLVNSSGGYTKITASFLLYPIEGKYLIQNGWTLSYEFYFYGLFALCMACRTKFWLVAVFLSFVVFIGQYLPEATAWDFLSNPLLLEFGLGIVAYYIISRCPQNKIPYLAIALLIAASILFGLLLNGFFESFHRVLRFGIPAFCLFVGLVLIEPIVVKYKFNVCSKVLFEIGNSSYSLYLIHAFTLVLFSKIIFLVLGGVSPLMFIFTLTLGSVVVGFIFYRLVELKIGNTINIYLSGR